MKKINLASGQRPFPAPWINVDLIKQFDGEGKQYALDIQTDASDLHMFDSDSVDIIVAHHLVEHIALHDISRFVSEWHRVLSPGGLLVVYVPNLKALDQAWIEGRIDTYIHNVNTYGAYQGHTEDLHKWGYDENELRDRLSGWDGNNRSIGWSKMGTPNYNDPRYQGADIARDWWILEMEFTK